nr:lysosome-associated membrane glycoprotein 2-like [Onthophagus taurus]
MFAMKTPILFLFLGLAAICIADTVESTVKINPEPPVTSTTNKPTTKTTTTSTTQSTSTSTTSTTTPPTTTTPTPSPKTTSTTPAPTTTPTTAAPVTTPTTAAPVTTPKPVPWEAGTWEVLNGDNTTCILLHMKGAIDLYFTDGNQTNVEQIQIPSKAAANGTCSKLEQKIVLSWMFNDTLNDTIEIVFKKNETANKFDLETINMHVFVTEKNSTQSLTFSREREEFETPVAMSYKCEKIQLLNFTDTATNETVASLMISNVQFQAFANLKDHTFASAKDCEPYETPDIVPIAVGCALIALIVFILIGYLVGRRRNQTRGYLSMFTQTKKEEDYIPMKNLSCFQ